MKIKYSALVSATSGKLNGSVAASNRGGAYLRNKGVVSNPQTVAQQANRSLFGSISSQFRALSSEQVTAWNLAAQDFPIIDRFGDTRYLSGLALYVQLNKNLADIGLPPISVPPAKQAFPAIASASLTVNVNPNVATNFTAEVSAPGGGLTPFTAIFRFTPSVSPSVSYVKNRYRNMPIGLPSSATSASFESYDDYVAINGIPTAGQVVYGEIVLVSEVSGEKSAPFPVSAIVLDEE